MSSLLDQNVAAFETHRRALTGLAYRMLGSRAEAEDIVQDARGDRITPALSAIGLSGQIIDAP